jgi:hypothetical protein
VLDGDDDAPPVRLLLPPPVRDRPLDRRKTELDVFLRLGDSAAAFVYASDLAGERVRQRADPGHRTFAAAFPGRFARQGPGQCGGAGPRDDVEERTAGLFGVIGIRELREPAAQAAAGVLKVGDGCFTGLGLLLLDDVDTDDLYVAAAGDPDRVGRQFTGQARQDDLVPGGFTCSRVASR